MKIINSMILLAFLGVFSASYAELSTQPAMSESKPACVITKKVQILGSYANSYRNTSTEYSVTLTNPCTGETEYKKYIQANGLTREVSEPWLSFTMSL